MYTVDLRCGECDIEFTYAGKEYKRQTEKFLRTVFYCSRSCACKAGNKKKQADPEYKIREKATLKKANEVYVAKRKFSRYILLCKRRRSDKYEVTITENDVQNLWEAQNGQCAVTGVDLHLKQRGEKICPFTLSIDRKESSLGYTVNNIQLVSYSANLAKNTFDEETFASWVKAVKNA